MKDKRMSHFSFSVAAELTPPHCKVMDTFGDRIERLLKFKSRREDREVSQRELARYVDLAQPTVRKIIMGLGAPQDAFVEKAAEFFDLAGSELEEFRELGKFAWLASNKDKSKYVWDLYDRLESLSSNFEDAIALLDAILAAAQHKGMHFPKEFHEKLATIKKRFGSLK